MTPMPAISTVILRTQSDDKLVVHARKGHERAFEAICDRYRPELARALRRYLPAARVDDVLQQTFISAWSAFCRDAEVRELRPWLHRIARNAALADLKRPGYDHAELRDALQFGAADDDVIEQRDVVRRTLAGIAELPERQREALMAIAVEGRPSAEVAQELGMSDPATRQMVRRARMALRTAVGAFVPSPVLTWALTAGHTIAAGEGVVGGTLGAGATAVALKAGAALTAGAIVASAPAVIHHQHQAAKHRAAVVAEVSRGAFVPAAQRSAAAGRAASGTVASSSAVAGTASEAGRRDHAKTRSASGRAHVAAGGAGQVPAGGADAADTPTATTPAAAAATTTTTPPATKVNVVWPWRTTTQSSTSGSRERHRDRPSWQRRPSSTTSGSSTSGSTTTSTTTTSTATATSTTTTTTTTTSTTETAPAQTTPTTTTTETSTTPDAQATGSGGDDVSAPAGADSADGVE